MIKNILSHLDKFCLRYLGIRYAIRPDSIKSIRGRVFIISTESNSRVLHQTELKKFLPEITNVEKEDKEKLGIAIGKALGKGLIVSFEDTIKQQVK